MDYVVVGRAKYVNDSLVLGNIANHSSLCIYNEFSIMGSLSLFKEPYELNSAVQQTTNNFANTISQGETYRNGGVTF